MDRVVVVGGSGFMGSHTADVLSERGYKVTIFDNTISPWLRNDQEMIIGDVLDSKALEKALDGARFVYHFAGIADIFEGSQRPADTINLNVMGTVTSLEASIKTGIERFIYGSTMYVYSSNGSFYRASKQSAELIIETYQEKFGLDYTLIRYGSLYGPRAQEWNGLQKYVSQIVRKGKLNYPGSGKERREYIHVRDAANLSVDILDSAYQNEAVTVTGLQVLNSEELIEMIFEITGIDKNVEFITKANNTDHYTVTPYRYKPKNSKKLVPATFIDLGQGILEIVDDINGDLVDD